MTATMEAGMADVATAAHRVTMVEAMPGFADRYEYDLSAIDDQGLLYSLRSADEDAPRFILANAEAFFPDYRPAMPGPVQRALGEELRLLLVVTVESGLRDATANLRAPLALHTSTLRAVQVVLDDDALPMRQPLLAQ
jgi:flagellar assembly factor FliW